jgi:hypothetical protein
MRGGNKALKRVFYQSAFASLRSAPESKAFYDRKRAEGKRHTPRLSSRWRVGGSTSFGRCCVMEPRSRLALRLDIFIEILPGISVNRDTQDGTSRARDPSRPAEQMEQMERNRDILQDEYARLAPEALNALTPEELRQVYGCFASGRWLELTVRWRSVAHTGKEAYFVGWKRGARRHRD